MHFFIFESIMFSSHEDLLSLDDWEVLSEFESMECCDPYKRSVDSGTSPNCKKLHQLSGASSAAPCDGLLELYLSAEDSIIQPPGAQLTASEETTPLSALSASSEASFEATASLWGGSKYASPASHTGSQDTRPGNMSSTAFSPFELPGLQLSTPHRILPPTTRTSSPDICHSWLPISQPGSLSSSSEHEPTPRCESCSPPRSHQTGQCCRASKSPSLADSVHSFGSVQLKLVRADEHQALQEALGLLERRVSQRERQLALARARLSETDAHLTHTERQNRLLRRVALVACSLCAVVGLRVILGPQHTPDLHAKMRPCAPAGVEPSAQTEQAPAPCPGLGGVPSNSSLSAAAPKAANPAMKGSPLTAPRLLYSCSSPHLSCMGPPRLELEALAGPNTAA